MQKKKIVLSVLLLVMGIGIFLVWNTAGRQLVSQMRFEYTEPSPTAPQKESGENNYETERTTLILREEGSLVDALSVPWDIQKIAEGEWLITERSGILTHLKEKGESIRVAILSQIAQEGESGLLGIVLHPQFKENKWIYLYQTIQDANGGGFSNQVVRFRYNEGVLEDEVTIVEDIPGAIYHDGGRIAFGPDGYLYITTGDATQEDLAQDLSSLAGKILRVSDSGDIPLDNPFGTRVYSYGHRNPQGLAWDDEGNLWSTEHGRSGLRSGMDELNRIIPGGNYGWPVIEGDEIQEGMIPPVLHSGPDVTWAPGGLSHKDGHLFWGGLRGQSLYQARIDGKKASLESVSFQEKYGRLRTTWIDQEENILYVLTSNDDGRNPKGNSPDKIIRFSLEERVRK